MVEWSRWTRVEIAGGDRLDLMHARLQSRFVRHAHAEFAIGVCLDGMERIDIEGTVHHAGPGTVVVIGPEQAHGGAPGDVPSFRYRVLYPSPAQMDALAGVAGTGWPLRFARPVIDDPGLAAELAVAHRLLTTAEDRWEADSRLVGVLGRLVRRHADPSGRIDPVPRHPVARQVMDRLADQLISPPSLAGLAAELGLSRYQLLRRFAEEVGMPPFGWLAQHRVSRARGLLERGLPPGEVAVAVGFADQAHLTRWFRRVLGVTPGAYRNSVQDSAR
jgi:AraC-like DNA-binding protein